MSGFGCGINKSVRTQGHGCGFLAPEPADERGLADPKRRDADCRPGARAGRRFACVQDGPLAADEIVEANPRAVGVRDPRLRNLPPNSPVAAGREEAVGVSASGIQVIFCSRASMPGIRVTARIR